MHVIVVKMINLYNFFCVVYADLVYQNVDHKYTSIWNHASPLHATIEMSMRNKNYHNAHSHNIVNLCKAFYELSASTLFETNYYTWNTENLWCVLQTCCLIFECVVVLY